MIPNSIKMCTSYLRTLTFCILDYIIWKIPLGMYVIMVHVITYMCAPAHTTCKIKIFVISYTCGDVVILSFEFKSFVLGLASNIRFGEKRENKQN